MTSLLRIALLLAIIAGISACGQSAESPPPSPAESVAADTGGAQTSEAAPVEGALPASEEEQEEEDIWMEVSDLPETNIFGDTWTGDYDAMVDRRLIRVLTVYSIGRYYLDHGTEKGLTYEMLKNFEQFVNHKQIGGHLKVNVVFIPVARNQLIPALLEGRGDLIAASLSITDERAKLVDFTIPASKPVSEILVTGPTAPELASIEDLSGHTIYVRHSSSYRESVEALNERLVAAGKDPVQIEAVSELLEDDDLIEMVNGGLLPWAIVDNYKTQLWDEVFENLVMRDDIVFASGARLAWAMRQGSPRLMNLANQFLEENRQGTLVGNVLNNRYIRDFDWAEKALDGNEYARFKDLRKIFETYGEQYGIDYLMIAAQGYQESRLNQDVRSRAGAVGVMQMLPSTAADPNVNIRDIHEVEANIHAGTKYMGYLRDRYFSDPEIDEWNRTLLALAAYNAGPGRMINMRRRAEKLGYDPNKWFDNVEVIAAKDIGRETVQYVSNIFKYYISYRLSLEQGLQRDEARERVGIAQEDQRSG